MSQGRKLRAIVPVGPFAQAKQRLASCLTPRERSAFARAMLEDVLSALLRAASLDGIVVITGDADAASLAHAVGATVLADAENAGINAAVENAARHCVREGRDGMLVIPADVPLITAADIEAIAKAHRAAPSVTLVRAGIDGGTNALACSPPDAMSFCFGEDSFRRHQEAARACGIEPQVLELARIERDIDRPEDLAAFLARPSATRSHACLSMHGIAERLSRAAATKRETRLDRVAQ
jgi:2-phospho-L-lactate guanylyltransferase